MNLASISTLTGRGGGLLTGMLIAAPSLRFAEFRKDLTDYSIYKDTDNFTGSAARAEGDPGKSDLQVPESSPAKLALYTREYEIDKTRLKDMSIVGAPNAIRDFADRRLRGLSLSLAEEIEFDMYNSTGLGAPKHVLGKLSFIADANAAGQTAQMSFTAAELAAMNFRFGLKLDTVANQDLFVEQLMKLVRSVPGANAIEVNASLSARMTTIAKRLHAYGQGVDQFGVPVELFNNIPLVVVKDTQIPSTQSDGVNNDNTSLFIVRYAEDQGVCYSTNGGFDFTDFPEVDSKPVGKARMDMNISLTVEKKDAIVRGSRIRL